jgi:hypothetical protein
VVGNIGRMAPDAAPHAETVPVVTRLLGLKRWLVIWLALLSLSAILARYFDNGPPTSWSNVERVAVESFIAPGGIIWTALFWHAFGSRPTTAGLVFIVLVNSTLWAIAVYLAARILERLRRR